MFKQIVSQLSLSPSAAQNLSFYARRLKQESVSRTFSAIAAVLIVGLQFTVILAPPTASNAASSNDIIYGGFTSKQDLLSHFDASPELKALYTRFGISRTDIAGSVKTQIVSTDHALKSIGRVRHSASDTVITVGSYTYYARPLYVFDTGANVKTGSYYDVFAGKTASGGYFAIMYHCGNIVFKTLYSPPPVIVQKPIPTPVQIPPVVIPAKTIACTYLHGSAAAGDVPLTVAYSGAGTVTNQTISKYIFNFGDNQTQTTTVPTTSHVYTNAGAFTATLQIVGSAGSTTAVTAPCSFTLTPTTAPNLVEHKSAFNVTQNKDATAQAAAAGDVIRYTLTVTNTGGRSADFTFNDDLTDVLEYATVTDAAGGSVTAGPNPGMTQITWPKTTVAANSTATKQFSTTVKTPVPPTPAGLSDKLSFDLRMDNVFGDTIHIAVTPPPAKQIETAAAALPDTGAGTSATVVILFAAFVIYFYARNKQLMTELKVLRGDYQGGSGQ